MSTRCLVTGANGFLGTNLVHALVAEGWQVRASGRGAQPCRWIADLPIEYCQADITLAEQAQRAVNGCEVVFNVAGDTSFWKRQYARQYATNVTGAGNVARACLEAGVRRLVHTSTADSFGYDPAGGEVDETHPFNYTGLGYHYGETKLAGDRAVHALIAQGLDAVLVHPGSILGSLDHTRQFGRLFFELKNGELPGCPPGGASFCHATEVAKAHVRAAGKGRRGESYILAGNTDTNVPHAVLIRRMAEAIDARPPRWVIPEWLLVSYAAGSEWLSAFTGKPPQLNPGQARYMSRPQYCNSDKARRELGYHIPSLQSCIEDSLHWYRSNGFGL